MTPDTRRPYDEVHTANDLYRRKNSIIDEEITAARAVDNELKQPKTFQQSRRQPETFGFIESSSECRLAEANLPT